MANYTPTDEDLDTLTDLLELLDPLAADMLQRAPLATRPLFNFYELRGVIRKALYGEQPHGIKSVVLNGSHLLLFQVVRPWYSNKHVLLEELFIRVAPGPLAGALDALSSLAKDMGCSFAALGSLLTPNDKAYTRLVEPHGYKLAANIMIKEIA